MCNYWQSIDLIEHDTVYIYALFFFFQAEDGIRDYKVTGVQTCALPIAIRRNPDNDQYYLSLTLVELREDNVSGAEKTLRKGLARIPSSGKILWGLGIVSVLEGKTPQAAENLERAVDLLPEWPGSYSALGVFYYQTGEITKAREVLNRFKGSNAAG